MDKQTHNGGLVDYLIFNELISDYQKKYWENVFNKKDMCFPSFEETAVNLGYVHVIRCKDCKHCPDIIDFTAIIPYDDEGRLDLICPFVTLTDCHIPPENFYCAYGEKKC